MLKLDGVTKSYGPLTALETVNLEIQRGEFLTLLGPSGSGKTTLLNIVAGTLPPTQGRLLLEGKDITGRASSARGFGMVFQNYALFPHLSIFENIAFPLHIRHVPKAEIRKRVMEALELVHLPDVAQRKPKHLSGGQQQRIAIARCLVYRPKIVLMDEPLGALDRKLRGHLQTEIHRLHKELQLTVLYVTHDQDEALSLSDRICVMNRGRIEQAGPPRALYETPSTVFVADFVGESNILDGAVQNGRLALRDGGAVTLPQSHPDSAVKVVIRPEKLRVLPPGAESDLVFEGRVERHSYLGGTLMLSIERPQGATLLALARPDRGEPVPAEGEAVRLGSSREDLILIEA